MKKIFSTIAIVITLSIPLFAIPLSHLSAQAIGSPCTVPGTGTPGTPGIITPSRTTGGKPYCAATNQSAVARCGVTEIGCQFMAIVIPGITGIILKIASLFTVIGGYLLNGVMYHTVVKIADNYNNLTPIRETWGVLRDLANISFIFVLLYAAIKTIIGQGENLKSLIVNVVVVAILMNFSLFFTRIVIDISNVLALTFYDAIVPGVAAKGFDLGQAGLSNAFMQFTNLTSLYQLAGNIGTPGLIVTGIMGSVMLIIAAFCFFAVAILFIIRYVVLILVMILSPIAFIAMALPKGSVSNTVGKYQNQWQAALVGQAFFAPIYFLMTWVALRVMSGISAVIGANPGEAQSALSGISLSSALSGGAFAMFINFAIVIVLIITSLTVAKEWADKAGSGVGKLTSWATGAAGWSTLGMAGRLGRGTLGRAGQMIADNDTLKKKGATSMMARLTLAAGRKTAGASFDTRNAGFASELKAGKGNKGGFADDMKGKIKAEKEYADSLKPTDLTQYKAERTYDDAKNKALTPKQRSDLEKEREQEKIRLNREKGRLAEYRDQRLSGGASAAEIKEIDEQIKRNERDFTESNDSLETYSRMKVDRIKGVDEGEAKKRAAKELGVDENELGKMLGKKGTPEEKARAQAAVDAEKRESAGNVRKISYARDMENKLTFGQKFSILGRVGIGGQVKKENIAAALEIRKSTKAKGSKDKLADVVKEMAKADAEAEETTATTPPPAVTPPPTTGPTT